MCIRDRAGHAADALVFGLLISLALETREEKERWPYVIFLFSSLILLRSICVCLNPLMPPLGLSQSLTYATHASEPGMFFSGHVAMAFLVFLLTRTHRRLKLVLTFFVALGLLLSRAHYSIDIVGGYAIAWCCYSGCRCWFRKWFLHDPDTVHFTR